MNKKLLFTLIFGIFFLSLTSGALTDSLDAFYFHNETSGNLLSILGGNTLTAYGTITYRTLVGADYGTTIKGSATTPGDNGYSGTFTGLDANTNTICLWFKGVTENNGNFQLWGQSQPASSLAGMSIQRYSGVLYVGTNDASYSSGSSLSWTWDTNLHLICGVWNDPSVQLWFDGVNVNNGTWDGRSLVESTLAQIIRSYGGNNGDANVSIASTMVWGGRALSGTELVQLYNGGTELVYPFTTAPSGITITLTSPENDSLITDDGSNFTATFTPTLLNLTNATYNVWLANGTLFNSTSVSLSGSAETNYSLFIDSFTMNNYKWGVSACGSNSSGYVNCSFVSSNYTFEVGASILNQTYSNITYETLNESFTAYVQSIDGAVLHQAYLFYNGTQYIATLSSVSNNTYLLTKTIDIPLVNSASNVSFFWQFIFTSPVQRTQNTTLLNQTITPIFFGECNGTYTNVTLNITLKNEANFSLINGSLEFNADYYLGTGTITKELQFTNTNNNKSNFQFCISPATRTFQIEDILSYYAPNHERREYFLDDTSFTSSVQQLALYLMPTAETSVFTIRVIDEDENNLEGVFVRVQRWDIGTNNFYTIGMIRTTSDGTGIINLRLNDAWYRYQVIRNDVLIKTTEPTKESTTERVIQVNLASENPYDQFENIDFELTYDNETNITSLTYADTSGAVQTGCLKVIKMGGLGQEQVYYSCVQSTSGVLSYVVPSDGTYIIRAIFVLTDEYDSVEKVIDEIFRQGQEERFQKIGVSGAFASLLLVGTAGLFGVSLGSIPLGIGLIVASLVIVNLVGWLNISLSVVIGLVSIFILIIFNLGREN